MKENRRGRSQRNNTVSIKLQFKPRDYEDDGREDGRDSVLVDNYDFCILILVVFGTLKNDQPVLLQPTFLSGTGRA